MGYKYSRTINSAYKDDISLKPTFQGWNINASFIKQWSPKFSTSFSYSHGFTKAKFYDTASGYAKGDGNVVTIGLGANIIKSNPLKKDKMNYGFEIRLEEYIIDHIKEPNNINKINNFHMKTIGLIYSFSIGYGGEQSLGDRAYLDMLNGNYILALEQFIQFENENPYLYKSDDINHMIEICRQEIPNQLYKEAIDYYYKGELDKAVKLLYKSEYKADNQLNFEIESKKYIIADEMFKNAEKIIKYFSIDEKIDFYINLKNISDKIINKVNKKISTLLIDKGDILVKDEEYKEAYKNYLLSLEYFNSNSYLIDIKIDNMTTSILNNVYNFLQIKEYVIAFEHLSFIKDISRYNENTKALMDIVLQKLENKQLVDIRARVHKILDNERQFVIQSGSNNIFLGDHFDEVLEILGSPYKMIDKKRLNANYEMLVFIIEGINYRLFFKNKILIDVEREL